MATASTKKQKIPRLQPADFRRPGRLSQEKVSEICEPFRISDQRAAELKDYLNELADSLHEWMSRENAANRQDDRTRIISMRHHITAAQYELTKAKGLGIHGRLAVRSTAERLADILSGDRLRHHFPYDARSRPMRIVRRSPREPVRDETYSNYQFIRHRAPETLHALLQDLESVLTSALTILDSDPRARGGLHPLEYRKNVILNLANIWHGIGKKVVGTPKSDFVAFCHYIFEVWGWPTGGLVRAIPAAVKDFRNRQENAARLR